MKRNFIHLFVVFMLISFSGSALAQLAINPGVKGGLNYVTIVTDADEDNIESKLGLHGGLFVMITPVPLLSFQAEALFTQKGAKETASVDIGGTVLTSTADYSINYVEIPLIGKLNLPVGDLFLVNIMAGPAFGIKLSEKIEIDGEDLDTDDFFEKNDIGLVLGVGGTMAPSNGPKVVADIRFVLGLTDIVELEDNGGSGVTSVKNSAIMATFGVAL